MDVDLSGLSLHVEALKQGFALSFRTGEYQQVKMDI